MRVQVVMICTRLLERDNRDRDPENPILIDFHLSMLECHGF